MSVLAAVAGHGLHGWLWWAPLVALLALAATLPGLQAAFLAALLFPALIAFSRFRVDGLAAAFLICQSLVHLLKRLIFVLGPQPHAVYLGIQLLPSVVVLLLSAVAMKQLRGRKLPWSARLLAAFLALSVALTLRGLADLPWLIVLSAIHQYLLPFLLYFAGLTLTPSRLARVGRTMAILACLSVVYGLVQLAGGPTALDRAWANETYSFSIHGGKVFAYLEGAALEFRSYSYYADPLTWGFALLAGLAGAAAARRLGRMSRAMFAVAGLVMLAGLFFTLTRTVWVGLAVALAVFGLLARPGLRRPWLVFALVMGSFAGVVTAGGFVYREFFLERRIQAFRSPILTRYLTVGTIEARTSAWNALKEAAEASPVWGQGYGVMLWVNRNRDVSQEHRQLVSHNFLVELVFNTGIPGALLFLGFFWQWLREAFRALGLSANPGHRRVIRWLIAFAAGCMVTGYLNGPSFMTGEWFLLLGAMAGLGRHWSARVRPSPEWRS